MDAAEIDEVLERYRAAATRIGANLVELDDHPTFALVTSGVLTGVTGERARPLAAAAPRLWSGLDALRRTLDAAAQARGEGRMNDDERAAVAAILTGPSVLVEVSEIPLHDRDLLGAATSERRVTLAALIDELRAGYEPLRDLVAEIDAVWRDVLPRLDAAETTVAGVEAELAELGAVEPAVDRARAAVDGLRRTVMDDPVGLGSDAGADLDRTVAEAVRAVAALRRAHDDLDDDLARTETLVAEARSLRSRAAALHAETLAKIARPTDLVVAPPASIVDRLAEEAAELRRSGAGGSAGGGGADGDWQHVRARLDLWLGRAERLVAQLRSAEQRNRAGLDRRDQLRGLLGAYRAKAATIGRIEDPRLTDLADEAHTELHTAPADLDRADALLAELAAGLTGGRP